MDPEAYEDIPVDAFPADAKLEPGMQITVRDDTDEMYDAWIEEIHPDKIRLSFNHPLAGETLHFTVKVVGLRPATAEELEHGHVHGHEH
jgi:FKBP-type peptidyl-prolyl cis-trans isomerase SlyD